MGLTTYMQGHKVPVGRNDAGAFVLGLYLDETARALSDQAQRCADAMQTQYLEWATPRYQAIMHEAYRLNKGFRPGHLSPVLAWHLNHVVHDPVAVAIRHPYVWGWLHGDERVDDFIAFCLTIAALRSLGYLTPAVIKRLRQPLGAAFAGMGGFEAGVIRELIVGKRAAHGKLSALVGEYDLMRERTLLHGALVYVARYCTGPGGKVRSWAAVTTFLQLDHSDVLAELGLSLTYARESEMKRAARPFVEAFGAPVKTEVRFAEIHS